MADQTTSTIMVDATPAEVMAVIADFPAYPAWAKGVKSAEPVVGGNGERAEQVRFVVDVAPIKDDYTLSYTWDGDREVRWTLVRGTLLRTLDGAYVLREAGGRTEVTYRLTLDLSMPLIGMLKRKGEKMLIDSALRGLKTRVESLHPSS